jgi:glycosyltransferase involved in cell wall biosynthesis
VENFTYQEKSGGDYLLFFGRFHADKGAREAIEIAQRAHKKLVMAGIIQDKEYFNTYIAPAIDHDRVEFVGSVGPEKRDRLLGGALALLHPIHFQEPFGLSVVESMACGTPVIAFNKGSMPEIIKDGTTGYLVRDVEEAVDAVGKINLIDRSACRHLVDLRFTQEIMTREYIKIYENYLSR